MGRRLAILALGVVLATATAGGAQGVEPLSAYLGTWTVVHDPVTAAPYDTGDHRITITTTSEAVALPVMKASAPLQQTHFCGASPQSPDAHPGATWFKLTYTWSGGGALYSCATQAGGLSFVEGSRRLDLTAFPVVVGLKGPVLLGTWYGTFAPGAATHPIKLVKSGAAAGGGGSGSGGTAGVEKTITAPAPGKGAVVSSPPLPADCSRTTSGVGAATDCTPTVTVVTSQGVFSNQTYVGEGDLAATDAGAIVANCWLIGPQTLPVTDPKLKAFLADPKVQKSFDEYGPQEAFRACLSLVAMFDLGKERKPSSAAAVCRAKRLALTFENGKFESAKLAPKLTAGSVRYGCAATARSLKLTPSAPGAKGGLRRAIGPTLQIGVVTSAKADKGGNKLTFKYSW